LTSELEQRGSYRRHAVSGGFGVVAVDQVCFFCRVYKHPAGELCGDRAGEQLVVVPGLVAHRARTHTAETTVMNDRR